MEDRPCTPTTTTLDRRRRLPDRPPPARRRHPARDRPGPRRGRGGRPRPRGRAARPSTPPSSGCAAGGSRPTTRPTPSGSGASPTTSASTRPIPTVALDWLGTYELPAGCSVAFYPGSGTKDGHGLLSRNFDFPTATLHPARRPPAAARRAAAGRRPVGGRAPPRRRLRVDRGRDHGRHGRHGRHQRGRPDRRAARRQRDARPRTDRRARRSGCPSSRSCATCSTPAPPSTRPADALRIAKHYYFFTPCHFVVADRSGRSFVWEHSPRRNHEAIVEPDPAARRAPGVHQPPAAPLARPDASCPTTRARSAPRR